MPFSTLGPRLDQGDFNTICDNVKYLALKQETITNATEDPLVILTKNGVAYLKSKWGKTVNKNGKKCHKEATDQVPQLTVPQADAQRQNNALFKLIRPFYTAPER